MKPHFLYLKYLLRHKWFVTVECWRRGLWWRGLVHDLSKFLPSEWFPYVEYFYTDHRSTEWFGLYSKYGAAELAPWGECVEDRFNLAWLLHQHRNPHHWQFWVLREDDGSTKLLPMPLVYREEMLCDWIGAGRAQGKRKRGEVADWYDQNRGRMLLNPYTRAWIEAAIDKMREK